MNKRIAVIANHTILCDEPGYSRYRSICELLSSKGLEVTLFVSTFDHYTKRYRNRDIKRYNNLPYKIHFINEPSYTHNVTIKRIIAYFMFALNLNRELKKESFDVVLCDVPSLFSAMVMQRYCKRNNIKNIIDVEDLWPEAFEMLFVNEKIVKIATFPIKLIADKVYRNADIIFAVSQSYLHRAKKVNKASIQERVVYIGLKLNIFDVGVISHKQEIEKNLNEFWITYAGTLGHSYDISTLILAGNILHQKGYHNIRIKILGRGPDEDELKKFASKQSYNYVDFLGYREYGYMAAFLAKSDLTVNAIVKRASGSIINKVGDYFASGRPVLNGCKNVEMQQLILDYNSGLNYEAENPKDLADKIESILLNETARIEMGQNARRLAELKFDRERIYGAFYETITSCIEVNNCKIAKK